MDAALRRRMQARALAGLDPTQEQAAAYEAGAPAREAAGNALGGVGYELTGIPQVGRAASGISEAVSDPSIPNVTNAAVQTGMAAFRPMLAAKALLAGYGASAAKQAGVLDMGAEAAGLTDEQKKQRDQLKARVAKQNWSSGAERRMVEDELKGLNDIERLDQIERGKADSARATAEALARVEAEKTAKVAKISEDERAVKTAEAARSAELAKDVSFADTPVGQMWNKTGALTPFLAAAGLGGLSRAASGGGNAWKNYALPIGVGAATGAAATNIPLASDAFFTPTENPQRRAYEAYSRELPPDHPRKQEWQDYARGLPQENPTRTAASKELYDGKKLAERMLFGLLEGGGGGLAGGELVRLPGRLASKAKEAAISAADVPGEVAAAGYRGGANAAQERTKAATQRGLAAEAEAGALSSEQALAEALRRSKTQTGGGVIDHAGIQAGGPVQPVQPSQPAGAGSSNQVGSSVGTRVDAIDNATAAPMQIQLDPEFKQAIVQALQQRQAPVRGQKTIGSDAPVGDWMNNWSGAGRSYADELLRGGTELTRGRGGNMTGAKLSEEIGARTGGSAPSVAEARDRAKMLIDDIAKVKKKSGTDSRSAFDKLTSDPKYTRFALPIAAGAGMSEAARQLMVEELMRGQQ